MYSQNNTECRVICVRHLSFSFFAVVSELLSITRKPLLEVAPTILATFYFPAYNGSKLRTGAKLDVYNCLVPSVRVNFDLFLDIISRLDVDVSRYISTPNI